MSPCGSTTHLHITTTMDIASKVSDCSGAKRYFLPHDFLAFPNSLSTAVVPEFRHFPLRWYERVYVLELILTNVLITLEPRALASPPARSGRA